MRMLERERDLASRSVDPISVRDGASLFWTKMNDCALIDHSSCSPIDRPRHSQIIVVHSPPLALGLIFRGSGSACAGAASAPALDLPLRRGEMPTPKVRSGTGGGAPSLSELSMGRPEPRGDESLAYKEKDSSVVRRVPSESDPTREERTHRAST